MTELHARLHVEGLTDHEAAQLPIRLDAGWLARLEISTWSTDAGDFDVLADLPDRDGHRATYDDLAARATTLHHEGVTIRAAALEDIIASKEWADRPKDHEALPELRRLRAGRTDNPERDVDAPEP